MRLINRPFVITTAAALTLCLASSVVAYAQERATNVGPGTLVTPRTGVSPDWGTTGTSVLTVPAWAFSSIDGSALSHTGPYNRFSASAELEAPVFLPAGAVITGIEMEGCDTDAVNAVNFILISINSSGAYTSLSPLASTGNAQTPGCGVFYQGVTPVTVDNANTYNLSLATGNTNATSVTAVRVHYHLQVSPAPGVASFSDVPISHPFFKFVEALSASGITAGCGGGKFCPDSPLTRGEMAVFLSTALGLYWPN